MKTEVTKFVATAPADSLYGDVSTICEPAYSSELPTGMTRCDQCDSVVPRTERNRNEGSCDRCHTADISGYESLLAGRSDAELVSYAAQLATQDHVECWMAVCLVAELGHRLAKQLGISREPE